MTRFWGDLTKPESRDVRAIFADSRGQVWVGFRIGGLGRVVGERVERVEALTLLDKKIKGVINIGEAPDGAIWLGTTKGTYRFKDDVMTRWTPPAGDSDR